ncbi:hypothetical protein L3Q82_002729 [Scortum barcoo]|uniref:Uncharacterized protein n=1 Tax=Scortum barcoo TaxID=214431 RepID=A0ACB8VUT6_9TELE|nr:hypothetical protein L3Q82_002729 [Scortum barcoo]
MSPKTEYVQYHPEEFHNNTDLSSALKQEAALDNGATVLNHSMSLVQRMETLLTLGNSSDVTLRVQTINTDEVKVIQAHSLVLTMQSDVFEELLLSRNNSALVLREMPDCAAVFDKFVRYLYCGDISVRLDQAISLHKLASKYHVWGLQQGLTQYMTQHLSSESPAGHVVGWYNYALQIGDMALRDSCLQYLSWNLSSVLQSGEWGSISEDLLLSLLQRSDLILQSELELYEALEAWINQNQPVSTTVESALKAVRYGMIPPQHLFRLQKQSPLMLKYYESIRDLLYLAFQFHSASPIQLAKYFDVNCSIFTPRNYLSSSWGSPWVINNPTRDDRSFSFQTQLGPSGHDSSKRVTWNALFSPRWLPLSARSTYTELGAMQPTRTDGGRPRIIVTPATSSPDFAGVSFQKAVIVMAKQQGKVVVRHVYNFHQSTEEAGDFLLDADLQRRKKKNPGLKLAKEVFVSTPAAAAAPPRDLDSKACVTIGDQNFVVKADDLEQIAELGRGAYGVVDKMKHVPSGVIMAVKRIRATVNTLEQKRLLMDLDISMRTVDCFFTVTFYGALFREGDVWICMELMDTSLDKFYKKVIEKGKTIPEDILGKITVAIVKALEHLHSNLSVIHRDVKPSNVLINTQGQVKMCDFGISGHLVDSVAKTMDAGCKPYMAPERINPDLNQKGYSVKSDIWSLGITMIELAILKFPYESWGTPFQQLKQVVDEPSPQLPADRFSPEFVDFISQWQVGSNKQEQVIKFVPMPIFCSVKFSLGTLFAVAPRDMQMDRGVPDKTWIRPQDRLH